MNAQLMIKRRPAALVLSTMVAGVTIGLAGSAHANSIPFSTGTFTLNHSTYEDQNSFDSPTVTSSSTLTMTNEGDSDANSAFYTTPVASGPFTASFVYQAVNPGGGGGGLNQYGADGVTFTIETVNSTDGTPATGQIGGRGSGLGWGNNDSNSGRPSTLPNYIANSVAVELTDYQQFQTGIVTAGPGGAAAGNYTTAGSLEFSDPTLVNLIYTGTYLDETLTDETTLATYTLAPVAVNIPGIVGGSTAYIGFTAGSGGDSSTETISNLSFTSTVPEPTTLSLLAVASAGLLARRRRAI